MKLIFALMVAGVLSMVSLVSLFGEGNVLDRPRMARLETCPDPESEDAAKCSGGMHQSKNFCVCLTHSESAVDGEIERDDIPPGLQRDFMVCEVDGRRFTRLFPAPANPAGCIDVARNVAFPGVTMTHVPSGIEAELCAACYPVATAAGNCPVTPASSGSCPWCLLDGDCE